ncbi:MAG: hypothetical protein ABR992_04420 [Solirubrobacteraceae bacterium]
MTPPAGSAAAAAPAVHRGRTAVPTRPSVAPRKPRRISGPARPAARPGPARRPAAAPARSSDTQRGLLLGVLAALNSLSRNPSLDRLIRGRTWIVLIAFALIGIVTLQLLVLRLNANIGRALVREAQLQRANAALSIESSELAAGERVESLTAKLGMELVPEGALRFLSINPSSDIARAAAALNKPVQTASTSSTEAAGASSSGSGSEAGAETSAATETTAAASTSAAGSSTSQSGEASTAASETGAAAPSESSATSAPSSTATQPASPETRPTSAVGATGATEATASTGASGTQAGGAD